MAASAPASPPKRLRIDSPTRPPRPRWLSADAKRMWRWLVPQLDRMGILQKIDGPLLCRYCQTWAKWKTVAEFLDKYGDTYIIKDAQGQPRIFMPFPQVAMFSKLSNNLSRMEQELGMSPSARSRIQVEIRSPAGSSHSSEFARMVAQGGPKPARGVAPLIPDFFDGGGPDAPRHGSTGEVPYNGGPRPPGGPPKRSVH